MKASSNSSSLARFLIFAAVILFIGTALFAAYAWTQQSTQERPVWDVQLARNAQAKSNITIQNQCQQAHTFTVTEQKTPYLQLLADATVTVPGNSRYDLPVRFDTNGMNPGQYQGNVVVKCDDCRKEKTCKQDREILPLHLVVLQESGPQTTPATQPQVPVANSTGGKEVVTESNSNGIKITTTTRYDKEGHETGKTVVDERTSDNGKKTTITITYDAQGHETGRTITEEEKDGRKTTITYDGQGHETGRTVTTVDGDGKKTTITYDGQGHETGRTTTEEGKGNPPITFQEKPTPPKALATASAAGEGFDEKGKKKDYKDIAYPDTIKPCKNQNCPKLQTPGSGKDLKIYCQRIELCGGGGEDCKNAECHMLVATMDAKEPGKWEGYTGSTNHGMISSEKSLAGQKDKDKAREKEIKDYAFKPEKGKAYRCSCY